MGWQIEIVTQRTANLCWEACGHMLWNWRYRAQPAAARDAAYRRAAGQYTSYNWGITEAEMDRFYRQLGMQGTQPATAAALRQLIERSPVIFVNGDQVRGHAMIATAFNSPNYRIVNPCSEMVIDFGANTSVCSASGGIDLPAARVEGRLGTHLWAW